MLSEKDYAGSGHKLCEAINTHTKHDIRIFTGKYHNPFGHPDHSNWNRSYVQDRINESDIVHLKGDFPAINGRYMGFRIGHKPVIITVSGSHFRKKKYGGYEKYKVSDYEAMTIRTAFTPDLLYEGFDIWTPHPIDSIKSPLWWNNENLSRQMMLHIPSRRDIKGTAFVERIFAELSGKGMNCVIKDNLTLEKSIELKKNCTIYFDQFTVGFYGNAAIEAMQYGIPVAAWIRQDVRERVFECPVITVEKNVNKWVEAILEALGNNMKILSAKTKNWCDSTHSYQAVARQWKDIYELSAI